MQCPNCGKHIRRSDDLVDCKLDGGADGKLCPYCNKCIPLNDWPTGDDFNNVIPRDDDEKSS